MCEDSIFLQEAERKLETGRWGKQLTSQPALLLRRYVCICSSEQSCFFLFGIFFFFFAIERLINDTGALLSVSG